MFDPSRLVMQTMLILVVPLNCLLLSLATAFFDLIKAEHESFRTVHFQSCNPTVIPWHVRLEPKTHDLCPFGVIQFCDIRFPQRVFKLLLQFAHVGHGEIHLNPAGRPRRLDILPDRDQHVAVTIAAKKIDLRMIDALHFSSMQDLREEALMQSNVAGLNLNAFQLAMR